MSLVELLNRASEKNFAGEPQRIAIRLQPGLTPQELKEFETVFPGHLPSDVQQLLAFASGFEVEPIGLVDFLGRHPFEFKDAFPYGVPLAGDGEGNFWVQDVRPDSGEWDKVFFVSHDPPVIAVQAHSLEAFLNQVLEARTTTDDNPLFRVKEHDVDWIWQSDSYLISLHDALSSGDDLIAQCAKRLGEGVSIADLRDADIGAGFSLRGLETIVRRCGSLPIFAIKNP